MRILLVDDDESLMEVLAERLVHQQYAVDIATDGEMGWEFITLFDYDLVLLDWMLPDIDGISLCRRIRAKGYEMPIMLLTARDRQNDKVEGLDAGADDYVVKPFDFEELTARIRALLRREIQVASPVLEWSGINLDPRTHEVKYRQQLLSFTPKEYALLELFLRHPQQVFSPGAIIDNLWAGEDPPSEEAVRTHIKGVRRKLQAAGLAKDTIQTIYGIGYRLKDENEVASDRQVQLDNEAKKNKENQNLDKINQIWTKFSHVTDERLNILEKLWKAFSENQVNEELQQQARSSAHKLAGSLGSFGFPEGSKIAKQLEILLDNPLELANSQQLGELINSLRAEIKHQSVEKVRSTLEKNITLLIVSRDGNLCQQLVAEAQQWGIKTFTADTCPAAEAIIERALPTVVLIAFPDGKDLAFLERLHQQLPLLPIAIITEDVGFTDRLQVVRRGGSLILEQPITPTDAIASVIELAKDLGGAAKILIVDDDPQVLLSLKLTLQSRGFQVTTLDDPQQFWQVLKSVSPDLLVLDIEMPEISGIELCQVLRSDRSWQQLPVLFLTVRQDPQTQRQAFAVGADDYICKPIVGSELANRILNRLERSRFYKSN